MVAVFPPLVNSFRTHQEYAAERGLWRDDVVDLAALFHIS